MHKKIEWKLVIPAFLFIIISIVIVILCIKREDNIYVTTVKTPYNIMSDIDTKDSIDVELYVSKDDSYFTDVNKIVSSSIESNDTLYKINVNEISKGNKKVTLYNRDYYQFNYFISFEYKYLSEYFDEIKEAKLNLEFSNGVTTNIIIGTLSIYKYEKGKDISDIAISQIKTISRYSDNSNMSSQLFGIKLGIRNLTDSKVNIVKVEPLDTSIRKYDNITLCNEEEISNIKTVFPDYPNIGEKKNNIEIGKDDLKYMVIPIVIDNINDIKIGTFGLKITYEIEKNDGVFEKETKTFYMSKFCFFDTFYQVHEENLKYYEYECE